MAILKAIGGVFVKIWRWIKNTAWIQPLLIVGVIFGVIFSIPSITSSIQNMINNNNNAANFFNGYKKTMEGGINSPAEKLLENFYNFSEEYVTAEDKGAVLDKIANNYKSEQKYFLYFTSHGDSTLANNKAAFEIARDNWNRSFKINDGLDFRLYTIFTDEVTSAKTAKESSFAQFMSRKSWFFEDASTIGKDLEYYKNGKITKEQLEKLCDCDPDNFQLPFLVLIDWHKKEGEARYGITQMAFSITGDNSWARADMLAKCWNGEGDFGPSKN